MKKLERAFKKLENKEKRVVMFRTRCFRYEVARRRLDSNYLLYPITEEARIVDVRYQNPTHYREYNFRVMIDNQKREIRYNQPIKTNYDGTEFRKETMVAVKVELARLIKALQGINPNYKIVVDGRV